MYSASRIYLDPEQDADDGASSLYVSVFHGHAEVVKVLLEVGGRDLAMLVAGCGILFLMEALGVS